MVRPCRLANELPTSAGPRCHEPVDEGPRGASVVAVGKSSSSCLMRVISSTQPLAHVPMKSGRRVRGRCDFWACDIGRPGHSGIAGTRAACCDGALNNMQRLAEATLRLKRPDLRCDIAVASDST